ncbi:hypothetical protein A7K93_10490 [Candidatus Methylacidiphilum fumarolicum]|nr:transposase [Candidatus Methylacidiphilum fumarolicum]TFE66905.1 hypothetical protein A7K73_09695 [Candidatus Methylacidiphilum fumarolicum]TFE71639.1 hypothetical protein A7K93_10490 [Candidatus Methylacidiphilum fumarolicum]TFE73215.1 hypothetical protein A7K72_07070 [Candidatus Methylacidiphilum fumarolicum]
MLGRVCVIAKMHWEGKGGQWLEFKGESDPLQLLLTLLSNFELSRFVKSLKTTSSRLLRREYTTTIARF